MPFVVLGQAIETMGKHKKQEIVEIAKKLGLVPGCIFRYTGTTLPDHYLVLGLSGEAKILPRRMNFNGKRRAMCRCTVHNISHPEYRVFDINLMLVQEGEAWRFFNVELITK